MAKKNQLTKSDAMNINDYRRLLNSLDADKEYIWELYARVSFYTALRSSDVLSLKWIDVLGKDKITKIEQKTQKTRSIAMNQVVQYNISRLYKLLGCPDVNEYMFKNKYTNRHISIQYVNKEIKKWKKRYDISIDNFSTHTFRKTFGRYVYDNSENKTEALVLLNSIFKHTSIEITKVYIGLRDDEVASIFQSINI